MTTCFRVTIGVGVFSEPVFVNAHTAMRLSVGAGPNWSALRKYSVPEASSATIGEVAGWMVYQSPPLSWSAIGTGMVPALMWTATLAVPAAKADLEIA